MGKIITIDGPAGSGKSTIGKRLAKKLNFTYLDTGAMFRALALISKEEGISHDNIQRLVSICQTLKIHFKMEGDINRVFVNNREITELIRTPEIDMLSSTISTIKEIRVTMKELQRKAGENSDIIAEGRDMGTVVFPYADRKFYLTATTDIRAKRRYLELKEKGYNVKLKDIKEQIILRDKQDTGRKHAPLKPAEDAIIIDTSHMTPDEVIDYIMGYIQWS